MMIVDTKWWIVAPDLSPIPNHEKISEIISLFSFLVLYSKMICKLQLRVRKHELDWCKHFHRRIPSLFITRQLISNKRSFFYSCSILGNLVFFSRSVSEILVSSYLWFSSSHKKCFFLKKSSTKFNFRHL